MITPSAGQNRPKILIIASQRDEAIQHCARILHEAGATIEWTSNVYAAMAMLAKGARVVCVMIDTRFLDASEAAFLSLAPRYFQNVDFIVPELESNGIVADAVRRLPVSRLKECVPLHSIEAQSTTEPPASFQEAPWSQPPLEVAPADLDPLRAVEQIPPALTKLSTEGGPRLDEEGLSLHEAVRKRMGANDPPMIRRRPPSAGIPNQPDSRNGPAPNPSSISDEELRALLDPRQLGNPARRDPDSPPRETP